MLDEAVSSPLELPADAYPVPSPDQIHSNSTLPSQAGTSMTARTGGGGSRNFEAWQVLKAIEKKDVMTLMEIKTSQFDLLISGTPLPVVYAMRLGKTREFFFLSFVRKLRFFSCLSS